jgi:hypothetical protein
VPGHDLLFNGIKEVPDENELRFWGSDSGLLMAYFGNPGLLSGISFGEEIGAFYGFFRGWFL